MGREKLTISSSAAHLLKLSLPVAIVSGIGALGAISSEKTDACEDGFGNM